MDSLILRTKKISGFSTLEILIATTTLVLTLSAVILVSFGTQSVLVDSQTNIEAVARAQALLEKSQSLARKDFKLVNPTATATDDIYQKRIYVETQPDFFTKKVTAVVSWQTDHGRAQTTKLASLVTNFENAIGGDTCNSVLSGDWSHPQVKNTVTDFAQLVGDGAGTYTITDVDAYVGKLYVTSNSASIATPATNPATGANDASFGTLAWSNTGNIFSSNNVYATRVTSGTASTNYLKATNFGFSIPQGATILGIKVELERSRSGGSTGDVRDKQVKIVKSNGTVGATDKADTATNWPTTDAYASYGNSQDLWGEVWSPADINSTNFGVVLSATGSTASTNRTAQIDHVRITVTYIKSFYILNITNPASPTLITGLGMNPAIGTGFNAVAVAGNYAYMATNAGPASGQLQVIDIGVTPPAVKATFIMPGVTGTGSQAVGQSIFYKNGYIYLGLTKTLSGPEFNIIDVHNPLAPLWLAGYSVGNGINSLYVRGKYAYLATPNSQELLVLNVGDPIHPALAGGFDAPDAVGNGKSISVVGDTAYLGRTVTASNPELYILDNSDPANIPATPLGTREISSSVNGMIVRDWLAFLITTGSQFQIWRIDNPASITSYASPLTLPNSGAGISLDCEGNYLYAAAVPSAGPFVNKGSVSIITGQ